MKIVVAPQALKGSLDAPEVGAIIAAALAQALPTAEIIVLPVADGGEGTTRALVTATAGACSRRRLRGRSAPVSPPPGESSAKGQALTRARR